jgi:hypothetical protein
MSLKHSPTEPNGVMIRPAPQRNSTERKAMSADVVPLAYLSGGRKSTRCAMATNGRIGMATGIRDTVHVRYADGQALASEGVGRSICT